MQRLLELFLVMTACMIVGAVAGSINPIPVVQAQVAGVKATQRAAMAYKPILEVFEDPKHHVVCYKDSWAGISVPLSCVYIPPVSTSKGWR